MVNLEVHITKRYFRLFDYRLNVKIPTSWAEVGEKKLQFITLLEVLRNQPIAWRQFVLHQLFGDKFSNIPIAQVESKILPHLEFVSQRIPAGIIKKFRIGNRTFTVEVLGRSFKIKSPFNRYLVLPKPAMADMRMNEYVNAMKQLTLYYNTEGNIKYLKAFAACLLREPSNYNTLERSLYDADKTTEYNELIELIPVQHMMYVMNEFISEMDKIRKVPKFKNLFPSNEEEIDEEEDEIKPSKAGIQDPNSYYDFLISVSESGIFGNYELTQKAKVLDVFFAMAKKNQDAIAAQIHSK